MSRARQRAHLFEEFVVGLFGGADFDRLHHSAGGDDDAADCFGGHGGAREMVLLSMDWNGWEMRR